MLTELRKDIGGSPEQEEETRKRERVIVDRLTTLIRFISGTVALAVTTEVGETERQYCTERGIDPEKMWYQCRLQDGETGEVQDFVHIPADDLRDITAAKGKAAHEAAHVRIDRSAQFVPECVGKELGCSALLASINERPTDEMVRILYPGAGQWLDHARFYASEGDAGGDAAVADKRARPFFAQLCNLIIYAPYVSKKEMKQSFDPTVISLYEDIRDAVERCERALPNKRATEEEIIQAAKDRYVIAYTEIWPMVRDLAQKDLMREALRSMLNAQQLKELLPKLTERLREELLTIVAIARGERTESAWKEGMIVKAEARAADEGGGGAREGEIQPLTGSSPELLEALENHFDVLSAEERETCLLDAHAKLEKLEAEIVESLRSVFMQTLSMFPTPGDEEQVRSEQPAQHAGKPARCPMEVRASQRTTRTPYEQAHTETLRHEQDLYARLLPLFRPRLPKKTGLKNAGNVLDMRAVFRRCAAKAAKSPAIEHRIFEYPAYPTTIDDAHVILLDLSGSMHNKINVAFSTVVMCSEVFSRFRVSFEVLGFQDELLLFKEANESLSDAVRRRMSGMLLEPMNGNPGGWNHRSFNDDGPCLLKASARLDAIPGKRKFLHVFSDGLPEGRYSTANDLHAAVATIREEGRQALIGYGMGPGTDHVARFYPIALPNIPIEALANRAADVIADLVSHPEKYGIKKTASAK